MILLNVDGVFGWMISQSTMTSSIYCVSGDSAASSFLPCFLVHGLMHDKAAVDVQDSLAHVDMLLQKDLDIICWLQQENVRGVGDKYLKGRQAGKMSNGSTIYFSKTMQGKR